MKKRTLLIMIVLLFWAAAAVSRVGEDQRAEGKQQLEDALRRTAVACYASEGFYPPDIAYMEQHYGLQYDRENYIVYYEVIASNLMPDITVLERVS